MCTCTCFWCRGNQHQTCRVDCAPPPPPEEEPIVGTKGWVPLVLIALVVIGIACALLADGGEGAPSEAKPLATTSAPTPSWTPPPPPPPPAAPPAPAPSSEPAGGSFDAPNVHRPRYHGPHVRVCVGKRWLRVCT